MDCFSPSSFNGLIIAHYFRLFNFRLWISDNERSSAFVVIPAKAGIQNTLTVDSRPSERLNGRAGLRGNDKPA